MTKERITHFLEATDMKKTLFCKYVGISQTMLWFYLHGERNISQKSEDNINSFIDMYKARVQSV